MKGWRGGLQDLPQSLQDVSILTDMQAGELGALPRLHRLNKLSVRFRASEDHICEPLQALSQLAGLRELQVWIPTGQPFSRRLLVGRSLAVRPFAPFTPLIVFLCASCTLLIQDCWSVAFIRFPLELQKSGLAAEYGLLVALLTGGGRELDLRCTLMHVSTLSPFATKRIWAKSLYVYLPLPMPLHKMQENRLV